jgi:sugar lactone lactonase YvrE
VAAIASSAAAALALGIVTVAAAVPAPSPVRPGALAVGRDGVLYVADQARHQILAMTAPGRFRVVAGTGKAGFSGDGGPAVNADLNAPAGMTVLRDGTLVFADSRSNRVRAISANGTIRTVAGDGRFGWVASGAAARAAPLGSPAAVTLGPAGRLYVALAGANEIVRLEGNGTLTRIAGNRRHAGIYGVGREAVAASPSGPNGLAFDRAGDLYIAGFNTKALLMIDRAGVMRHPDDDNGFYPRGDGGVTTAPDGRVIAINTRAVVSLTPVGEHAVFRFGNNSLRDSGSFVPNGIAIARDGSIYLDTYAGNGWTSRSAIVVISPGGRPRVLWHT